MLIFFSAHAQNLFVTSGTLVGGKIPGTIYEYTPGGVQSTFASVSHTPNALAFDSAGNLFVTTGIGEIQKFTPGGAQSIFATGLFNPMALAVDSAGNLFVGDEASDSIYEYTPGGVKSTFATGLLQANGLAFDSAGDLFVASFTNSVRPFPGPGPSRATGIIYEFSPDGMKSIFATGLLEPSALAFDSKDDPFVASGTIIDEYTPGGALSTFATGLANPISLAFDSTGDLYVSNGETFGRIVGGIFEYTPTGVQSTFVPEVHANGLAFQGETLPAPSVRTSKDYRRT
jgi:glucose/arabinose dehydrogenase